MRLTREPIIEIACESVIYLLTFFPHFSFHPFVHLAIVAFVSRPFRISVIPSTFFLFDMSYPAFIRARDRVLFSFLTASPHHHNTITTPLLSVSFNPFPSLEDEEEEDEEEEEAKQNWFEDERMSMLRELWKGGDLPIIPPIFTNPLSFFIFHLTLTF